MSVEVEKGETQCKINKEVMFAPTNADRTHLEFSSKHVEAKTISI